MSSGIAPEHVPVLVERVKALLELAPGQIVFDGTVGLAGHAVALAPALAPGGRYLGVDVDADMVSHAAEVVRAANLENLVHLRHGNYADLPALLSGWGVNTVNRMLLDLGANSAQLDDAARGFSFDRDGPLDMRFDRAQEESALDLVNRLGEKELADLFYEFGQEGLSRRIAKRICQVRHESRITTTRVLARAVESALDPENRGSAGGKIHPATRVFQALRVRVNRELDNLERFLGAAPRHLNPGGRLAVISFHSLEDGIVKRAFKAGETAGVLREITRRPEVAEAHERHQNPRSRSAKLRVAVRTDSVLQ